MLFPEFSGCCVIVKLGEKLMPDNMKLTVAALIGTFWCICCLAVPVSAQTDSVAQPKQFNQKDFSTKNADGMRLIHVPPGIYLVNGTLRLPSHTILEGEGEATVLIAAAGFSGESFVTNVNHSLGNRNIIVRNMKIIFELPTLAGDENGILRFRNVEQLKLQNLILSLDSQLYGIDLTAGVRDAVVEECQIVNINRVSGGSLMIRNGPWVSALETSDMLVRNNRLESRSDEPVAVFGWQGTVKRIRIENNVIAAHGASFGITAYGIDDLKHRGTIRDITISGNHVSGGRVGGIAVKGGARQVVVSENTVEDTAADGIFLHSGGDRLPEVQEITLRRNIISRAGRHCIFAAGGKIDIVANSIVGCHQSGIYVAGDISAVGNLIADTGTGILVDSGSRKKIRDNRFRNTQNKIVSLQRDGANSSSRGPDR